MPLELTVARSPRSTRYARSSSPDSSGVSRHRRRLSAMRMTMTCASSSAYSSYSADTNEMSRTTPTFTPRKLTSLPTLRPVTGWL